MIKLVEEGTKVIGLLKNIALLLWLGVAAFSLPVSASERLRPLTEALEQEQSPQMLLYVFQRCAALLMKMAHEAEGDDRAGADKIFQFMKSGYEAYTSEAINLINAIEKRTGNDVLESQNEALEAILELHRIYSDEMKRTRLLTGNILNQQTQADLELCANIMSGE